MQSQKRNTDGLSITGDPSLCVDNGIGFRTKALTDESERIGCARLASVCHTIYNLPPCRSSCGWHTGKCLFRWVMDEAESVLIGVSPLAGIHDCFPFIGHHCPIHKAGISPRNGLVYKPHAIPHKPGHGTNSQQEIIGVCRNARTDAPRAWARIGCDCWGRVIPEPIRMRWGRQVCLSSRAPAISHSPSFHRLAILGVCQQLNIGSRCHCHSFHRASSPIPISYQSVHCPQHCTIENARYSANGQYWPCHWLILRVSRHRGEIVSNLTRYGMQTAY